MTLRGRLSLTLVAAAALLALPLVYATSRLAELRQIAVQFRERHTEAFQILGGLSASLTALDRYTRSYVAVPDPAFRQGIREERLVARDAWRRLGGIGYQEAAVPVGALLDSLERATERIETLIGASQVSEATTFLGARVRPLFAAAAQAADGARDVVNRASEQDVTRAAVISHRATRVALVSGVVALALALAGGFWTTWRLTRPLSALRDAMATVAAGDFVAPAGLPESQQDEIGDLARSFCSMTERLAQLDHLKGEFVNAISHDLKAPLGMIGTCAELIEEQGNGELPPEQRELLATIREHVRVLAERVNKLLHLSRLEAGGFPIQPEPVPVRQIFDAVRRTYTAEAERRGLALTVVVDASLPTLVTVDTDCFYNEILGNLVSNALKFTPRGGRVEVRVWGASPEYDRIGDALRVTVTDTGIGIPEAELPFVFLKYYQVGGRRRNGTGLGLAIVRQAVEAHDGTVTAESTPGHGTTFHVTLPVAGPWRSPRDAWPTLVAPGPRGGLGDAGAGGRHRLAPPAHDRSRPTEARPPTASTV